MKILELNKCEKCCYAGWYAVHDFDYCGFKKPYTLKSARKKQIFYTALIPDWCPLPNKDKIQKEIYSQGWNDCMKEHNINIKEGVK